MRDRREEPIPRVLVIEPQDMTPALMGAAAQLGAALGLYEREKGRIRRAKLDSHLRASLL